MSGQVVTGQTLTATVALAAAGDEAAFARLVAANHADMARVAFVVCGDRALAEDAVQAAWLVAWQKLRSVHDPDRVRPWLVSVTANEARQMLRRRRGPVVEIDMAAPDDPRSDPAAGIERVDLRRALSHLSADDRALLAMRYVIDLTPDELATALGTSPSTARTRLSRVIGRLRKELGHD